MKTIHFKSFSVFAFILIITAVSCKKIEQPEVIIGEAQLKAVNAVKGSDPQDFYQNDKKLSTTPIAYGEATSYLTIVAGTTTSISLKSSVTQQLSASNGAAAIIKGLYTTFYYKNELGVTTLAGFENDPTAAVDGKSKVRFLNLDYTHGNRLNFANTNTGNLAANVIPGNLTNYYIVDANTAINMTTIASNSNTITIPASVFLSGKNYTIWIDADDINMPVYHIIQEN